MDSQQQQRQEELDRARAIAGPEGQTDPQTRADQEAWVRGEISHDELMERIVVRLRGRAEQS